jgi:hypothetical protein
MDKYICINCDWVGTVPLKAPNPFYEHDTLYGCPNCKSAETIRVGCDVEGCTNECTCGFPTTNGYRRVCGKHYAEYRRNETDKEAD